MDGVDIGGADDHEIDVLRRRPGNTAHARGEGSVDERCGDPFERPQRFGEQHLRARADQEDLSQRLHEGTVWVGAHEPGAPHLTLAQDARIEQPLALAMNRRVGQVDTRREVGEAELVPGEQELGEKARPPSDRKIGARRGASVLI